MFNQLKTAFNSLSTTNKMVVVGTPIVAGVVCFFVGKSLAEK